MSVRKPDEEKIGSVAPFGLRLLPELRQRLEEAASRHGHSLNREITRRLERSFDLDPGDETRLKTTIEDAIKDVLGEVLKERREVTDVDLVNDSFALGMARIADAPEEERAALAAKLVHSTKETAMLLGIKGWDPPSWREPEL